VGLTVAVRPALPGRATPEGTAGRTTRFAPSLGAAAFGPLGATGLAVSRLGFGGYRVDDETPAHRAALERACLAGVNVLDTSTNYTDGASERLIGTVLRDLMDGGRLRRDEMVVVSKIGYVQGRNLALAREREAAGRPFPEMVKYTEGVWHCIHPEFLEDQLGRSLDRLGLATLDVCLLHNPEYFFSDAKRRHAGPLAALRGEFDRRLAEAFRFFERQVGAGTLAWYGVSSNTVAGAPDDSESTSLPRMLAAAREAAGSDHHFRVLQLPLNLFESAGARRRTGEPAATVLEQASREGIGVLSNRPLNAIVGSGMLRLADVHVDAVEAPLEMRLRAVATLEEEYQQEIAPGIRVAGDSTPPEHFFRWAEQLAALRGRIQTLTHWEQIEGQIGALVHQVARALDDGLAGPLGDRWRGWFGRYRPALGGLLGAFRAEAGRRSQAQAHAVREAIDPRLPPQRRGESLSRKALWVLASTPGVSVVLNGMRSEAYVDDAVGILRWPPLADPGAVYEAVAGLAPPRD
jgi:aryl-alcohol dehydrogenase-like predicted oxidoreductase